MTVLKPKYIKDSEGNNMVLLSEEEFEYLLEGLEELEDIRLFDEAKKNDSGERISMENAFQKIESNRKK